MILFCFTLKLQVRQPTHLTQNADVPQAFRICSQVIQKVRDQGPMRSQQGTKPLYSAQNPSLRTVFKKQSAEFRYKRPLKMRIELNQYKQLNETYFICHIYFSYMQSKLNCIVINLFQKKQLYNWCELGRLATYIPQSANT